MSLGALSGYRINMSLKKLRRSRAAKKAAETRRKNRLILMQLSGGYEKCAGCPRTIPKSNGGLCGHCFSKGFGGVRPSK